MTDDNCTNEIIQKLQESIRKLQIEIANAETMDELVMMQSVSNSLQTQLKESVESFCKRQLALWTPINDSQTQKPPPLATRLLQTQAGRLVGDVGERS